MARSTHTHCKRDSLFGHLDDEVVGSVCESHECVAIVMVVDNQLAASDDGCQYHHEEGGDGWRRLGGGTQDIRM